MASVQSPSYDGRYYLFEVWQGSGTAIEWKLSSIGGNSGLYATSVITCVINGVTVKSYPQKNWYGTGSTTNPENAFPQAKGSVSGTYDPGSYGTFSFSLTGQPFYYATPTSSSSITTVSPYTKYTVNSWSAALSQNIMNLKSTITANLTKGTDNFSYVENEISHTNDNIVKQITAHSGGNYSGTSNLTCTATEIMNSTGLGVALYSNLEISDGTSHDELYSSAYTPPTNINTAPTISGTPAVTKVTASNIQISVPAVSNWVRSESTAFYGHALTQCNSDGTTTNIAYMKWGQAAQTLGTITMVIGSAQSSAITSDPTTETVSAGTGTNYTLSRGSTYYFKAEAITKFLGLRKNSYSSLSAGIYIPYLPSISAAFSFGWLNADGALYYRMTQANVTPNNPNNENLGNGYLSLNTTKVLRASVSGNIWTANSTNSNLRVKYTNAAISGTARAWQYYATNKYSESIIDPVETSASYSVAANRVNCSIGTPTITQGVLKTTNVTFNVPDTSLPVGTMTAVLQVSKSSNFSTITYQQEKSVTAWGNIGQLFDPITLGKGDVGTNYVRVLWKLANSSNYYAFANVYSNTASAEFTGILPKIDSLIATTQTDGKIAVTVNESTGAPTPTLTIEVSKTSGGSVYQSFNATNGTAVVLPYTEPGTVWYIKAKASNVMGTVYALEEDGTTQVERMIEIPYTVTDDYENVANPTITAGDVQLDGKCNFTMDWTKITTNVDRVVYNVEIATSNNPISPMRHENVQPGLSYTYDGRIDGEVVSFQLECVLYNSLDDVVATYIIFSNEITLDSVDTEKITFVYTTFVSYHSVTCKLASISKNSNKLVSMFIKLVDTETDEQVGYTFIGDEQPTSQSLDLDPIEEYVFDGLKANHKYKITISMTGANPLDISKISTREVEVYLTTLEFNVNPIKNLKYTITNIIDDIPTTASDIDMTWEKPTAGDEEPQSYIVAYKKTGQSDYTNIFLTDLHYVLAHTITDLANNDTLNIRVGAQYFDYFGTEIIKWVDLPPVVVAGTNYKYYVARYPETEIADKHIYKIVDGEDAEELVRDLYLDK